MATRSLWASLTDSQLLHECAVDTYRASGPGGQKRNKTSSAVRLRHLSSGLIVIAEESRSQHENKARALRRLRKQFYLKLREPFPPTGDELATIATHSLRLGVKDPRFWPAAGVVLDALEAAGGSLRDAANALGLSTARLVGFLSSEPKLWEEAIHLRQKHGRKPLHA